MSLRVRQHSSTREFIIRNLRRGGIFIAIGGLGFVVDALVYNLLVFAWAGGPFQALPLAAKTISIVAGLVVTYVGNKLLTYRDRKSRVSWLQIWRYAAVNVLALLLQLASLAFSRYVLGMDTLLADNISGTIVGQALATVLRYVLYTKWVFPHSPAIDPITYIEDHHGEIRPS